MSAVVHVYGEGDAYEVEFVTAVGEPLAVLTLTGADVRPLKTGEILHAREFASS